MTVSLEGLSPEAIADLAVTLKTLTDNPKTRAHTLALMKHADPSLNIPEIDIPNRMAGVAKAATDRIQKLEDDIMRRDLQERIRERRSSIVKSGMVSESEVPEVEKLMLEKGISNHETAAEFYASQKKAAAPTPGTFGQPLMPKPDLKAMGGNISQWARSEAQRAITDFTKARRAA